MPWTLHGGCLEGRMLHLPLAYRRPSWVSGNVIFPVMMTSLWQRYGTYVDTEEQYAQELSDWKATKVKRG